jgi:hypothetical protein
MTNIHQPPLDEALTEPFYLTPEGSVSQGDLFSGLLVYRADAGARRVRGPMMKSGGGQIWEENDTGARLVIPAAHHPCLVLSHDCAIDKGINEASMPPEEIDPAKLARRVSKSDVLVVPIRPVPIVWSNEKLQSVASGEVIHQFLLPPHERTEWVGGYADLRWIVTYRLADLQEAQRLVRLNTQHVSRLQVQLGSFFSFREAPAE